MSSQVLTNFFQFALFFLYLLYFLLIFLSFFFKPFFETLLKEYTQRIDALQNFTVSV